jgi:asparagine synthase (glutamine-hydrolysing)
MASAMVHRGPDDSGFFSNDSRAPGTSLGMRRLSIIDLSGGHQPIWNESHDVCVVFNGELYNYRELRRRISSAGHTFSTNSDTEILVHGWEEWGEDMLPELRGMFTFALVDLRNHFATVPLLFLARDPLGIKPLYYAQTSEGFCFASELRAILATGLVSRRLSPDALTSYLLFGSVSEPVTLIDTVFSVPPGHRLLLHLPDRRRTPRARPWWDPRRSPAALDPKRPRNFQTASQELPKLLDDSVRTHLIADVPVGLFLSSGLDSSAIAALAARAQHGIQSFTLSFPGTAYDEAPLARLVAQHTGTTHTEVPLSGSDMLFRIDEAVTALDQPSMDGINTYFVSWAARQVGLKVALSGLGGDELLAGYTSFTDTSKLARMGSVARMLPASFRRVSSPLLKTLFARRSTPDAARKISDAWQMPEVFPHPYFFTRLLFPPSNLHRLIDPLFHSSRIGPDGASLDPTWLAWLERTADQSRALQPIAAISWLELRTYMNSTLLRDTDSVSMARSLEVRVPFLDTPLVEFMCALPDSARVRPDQKKALLLKSMEGLLPAEILRQKKRTFTLPWEAWLRAELRPKLEASFSNLVPALASHLHAAGVRGVWDNFLHGQTTWSRPWSLYVLNEWCRQHLS